MKKGISYIRVSSEDQKRGWSLPTQLQAIHDYAARAGIELVGEYADDETAKTLERTNFTEVRERLQSGEASALVVYVIDRLSRDHLSTLIIADQLQRMGIEIHIAKHGRVMGRTAEDRIVDHLESLFAQIELEKILERTARGRRGKIESGRYLGNGQPPFGYRTEGQGRETSLVIDEEQAEIVRMIFHLFAYGDETGKLAASEIARRLTTMGFPTPADIKKGFEKVKKRAQGQWGAYCIYPLLRNSVYVGRFTNGRYRLVNGKWRRHWDGRSEVKVPAIVDEETWKAVQKRLDDGKAQSPRRTTHEYLVAKRLKCVCGYHLIGAPSVHPKYPASPYLYYRCAGSKGHNVRPCTLKNIPVKKLDAIVWEWMKEVLVNPDELEAALRDQSARQADHLAEMDAAHKVLYQRKIDVERELNRLLELYTRGSFPIEILDVKAAEKRKMLGAIEEAIDHSNQQRQTPITDDRIAALRAFMEEQLRGIEEAERDFTARRQLVELMDVRVQVVIQEDEVWLKLTSDLGEGLMRFEMKSS